MRARGVLKLDGTSKAVRCQESRRGRRLHGRGATGSVESREDYLKLSWPAAAFVHSCLKKASLLCACACVCRQDPRGCSPGTVLYEQHCGDPRASRSNNKGRAKLPDRIRARGDDDPKITHSHRQEHIRPLWVAALTQFLAASSIPW